MLLFLPFFSPFAQLGKWWGHERFKVFCLGGACAFLLPAEHNDAQSQRPKHAENLADEQAVTLMVNSLGSHLSSADRTSLYPSCGKFYPRGLELPGVPDWSSLASVTIKTKLRWGQFAEKTDVIKYFQKSRLNSNNEACIRFHGLHEDSTHYCKWMAANDSVNTNVNKHLLCFCFSFHEAGSWMWIRVVASPKPRAQTFLLLSSFFFTWFPQLHPLPNSAT